MNIFIALVVGLAVAFVSFGWTSKRYNNDPLEAFGVSASIGVFVAVLVWAVTHY